MLTEHEVSRSWTQLFKSEIDDDTFAKAEVLLEELRRKARCDIGWDGNCANFARAACRLTEHRSLKSARRAVFQTACGFFDHLSGALRWLALTVYSLLRG